MNIVREGKFGGTAGMNQPMVSLEIEEGIASIHGRKIRLTENVIALWHKDSAGTWHGFHDPIRYLDHKSNITPEGVIETSLSGGKSIVAAVIKIPENGILIETSGYDGRRGWKVMVLDKNGTVTFKGTPNEWRAKQAEVEEL